MYKKVLSILSNLIDCGPGPGPCPDREARLHHQAILRAPVQEARAPHSLHLSRQKTSKNSHCNSL